MNPARQANSHGHGPGDEDVREVLTRNVQLFARRWRAALDEALKDSGQTFARWRTLYVLKELGDGASQRDLASAIGIEEPGLVRLLDALEEAGLVARQVSSQDRRSKLLFLLPAGRRAVATGEQVAAHLLEQTFAGLDERDLAASARVFAAALSRLEDREAD